MPLEDDGAPGEESIPTPTPKRKVSYNQKAVLCPVCTKRIRLNNSGRLRVHLVDKVGSDKCMGSNSDPVAPQANFADVDNSAHEAKTVLPAAVQKDPLWQPALFSDLA